MKVRRILMEAPEKVRVEEVDLFDQQLADNEILVKTLYTTVSIGTELFCRAGQESWFPLPNVPGYSGIGEILAIGTDKSDFKVGDIITYEGKHASRHITWTNWVTAKVPNGVDLKYAALLRLANISLTAVRNSQIQLGDFVGVSGAGMIGNFAAQLAGIQGAEVIGFDFAEHRLAAMKKCGIKYVINPKTEDAKSQVAKITDGNMIDTFVEATGFAKAVPQYLPLVKKGGEMVLLGSPRESFETDLTPVLNAIHLEATNVTLKGAHEGSISAMPAPYVRHSKLQNIKALLRAFADGKLKLEPLGIKFALPEEMPEIYAELAKNRDAYTGVVIDWTKE